MTHRFAELMFTPAVQAVQARMGSRGSYERFLEPEAPANDRLGPGETAFIAERDSFYMATVSETGWPYVQHRGGPPGFVKVLDERTIGFADYKGNRQYVSVGNLGGDDRVSLILMDYPNQRRLKIVGHARIVDTRREPATLARLEDASYGARIERAMVIAIEGYDWNCPQHITPRFTEAQVRELVAPLIDRLQAAEAPTGGDVAPPAVLGNGPIETEMVGVEQLAVGVRGYKLRAVGDTTLPAWNAGAHITVPVLLADGTSTTRQYSLAGDPAEAGVYEFAVLDVEDGRGGSRFVHDRYQLGQRLRIAPPVNAFGLDAEHDDVTLIAGGIGVTAIRSMALALARAGRRVVLHYVGRAHTRMAFVAGLSALGAVDVRVHATQDVGRPDVASMLPTYAPGRAVYVCGPEQLIASVETAAASLGWPTSAVRAERFTAARPRAEDRPFDIVLARSARRITVAANETALEALETAGVPVPSSCRTGTCGTCIVKLMRGEPEHRDRVLSAQAREAGGFAPCVSRAASSELVLDL